MMRINDKLWEAQKSATDSREYKELAVILMKSANVGHRYFPTTFSHQNNMLHIITQAAKKSIIPVT